MLFCLLFILVFLCFVMLFMTLSLHWNRRGIIYQACSNSISFLCYCSFKKIKYEIYFCSHVFCLFVVCVCLCCFGGFVVVVFGGVVFVVFSVHCINRFSLKFIYRTTIEILVTTVSDGIDLFVSVVLLWWETEVPGESMPVRPCSHKLYPVPTLETEPELHLWETRPLTNLQLERHIFMFIATHHCLPHMTNI